MTTKQRGLFKQYETARLSIAEAVKNIEANAKLLVRRAEAIEEIAEDKITEADVELAIRWAAVLEEVTHAAAEAEAELDV